MSLSVPSHHQSTNLYDQLFRQTNSRSSRMDEMNESCRTYEWVMSHISTSHVTRINQSHRTYEQAMLHTWMRHNVRTNTSWHKSRHSHEWVISHLCMSHVTYLGTRGAMWHICLSHVAHMNEPCHTHAWVTSQVCLSHVANMNETHRTYEGVKSHTGKPAHMNQSFHTPRSPRGPWDFPATHMNESCHTWMNHVAHTNESRHTHGWVMPHAWMSHVTSMHESCQTYEWVTSHIWVSHSQRSTSAMRSTQGTNESCHTCGWVMSWVMSYIWMSHVIRINESYTEEPEGAMNFAFNTGYQTVKSYIWMSHVPQLNESCTKEPEGAMSFAPQRMLTSDVTHMKEWCHTYEWVSHRGARGGHEVCIPHRVLSRHGR